jgi:hypothetical protein
MIILYTLYHVHNYTEMRAIKLLLAHSEVSRLVKYINPYSVYSKILQVLIIHMQQPRVL